MAPGFDINPAVTSFTVEQGKTGQLAFPVTNQLGRQVDMRAELRAEPGPHAAWLSIQGESGRTLKDKETTVVEVQAKVPAGVPLGAFRFQLVVSNIAKSDDEYAESSPIELKTVEPTVIDDTTHPPPFKWWLVALIAGLVAIIGGGVAIWLWGRDPGFLEACKGECRDQLLCVAADGPGKQCLRAAGQPCEQPAHCASSLCQASVCIESKRIADLFPNWNISCTPSVLSMEAYEKGADVSCKLPTKPFGEVTLTGMLRDKATLLTTPAATDFLSPGLILGSTTLALSPGELKVVSKAQVRKLRNAANVADAGAARGEPETPTHAERAVGGQGTTASGTARADAVLATNFATAMGHKQLVANQALMAEIAGLQLHGGPARPPTYTLQQAWAIALKAAANQALLPIHVEGTLTPGGSLSLHGARQDNDEVPPEIRRIVNGGPVFRGTLDVSLDESGVSARYKDGSICREPGIACFAVENAPVQPNGQVCAGPQPQACVSVLTLAEP